MKQDSFIKRLFSAAIRIAGPLVLTALPYLAWTPISRGLATGTVPGGIWVWLLLPPALALEWWISQRLDQAPAARTGRAFWMAGLVVRLCALCVGFFVLVGRTAALLDTPDIYAPLIGLWPVVATMPYIESPILGGIGLALIAAVYLWVTVHQRRFRMTTTLILPAIFTLALFQFYYAFPTSPLHFKSTAPDRSAERVFPFSGEGRDGTGTPFMARDIFVTDDESTVIASYGVTFQFFRPGEDLNLARIDLSKRLVQTHFGRVIRTFRSTCSDRLYAAPWNGSTVLEIDPANFHIEEIMLPGHMQGHRVEEIHGVVHDCERGHVIVANSRNPAVFIWNTSTRTVEKTLVTSDLKGVRVGDHVIPVAIHPTSRAVYLGTSGTKNIIELSPETMEPVRWGETPDMPFDMTISPDGKFLYMTSFVSGRAWKIDNATLKVVLTFDVPIHSRRVAPSHDGKLVFILSYLTGELLSYDADTGRMLRRLRIGPKPEGLFVSNNYVWVSAATGIFRVPLEKMAGAQTYPH